VISLIIYIAIAVVVLVGLYYLAKMLPPQFQPFVNILFIVAAVIIVIMVLLQLPALLHSIPHAK
jgi:hypothetical protein